MSEASPGGPVPPVSCAVATFNDAGLAERCLRSILDQTLAGFEIIVADDSTGPEVSRLVEDLRRSGAPIVYLPGACTGNPVDNWNLGLDRARGAYSVLVHHDEAFVDKTWLARAVRLLEGAPGRSAVAGHIAPAIPGGSRFPAVSRLARLLRAPPWTLYMANWVGPTAAVLFPTAAGLRFDRRLTWTVDVDFYARLWTATGPFLMDARPSVASMPHAGQITAGLDVLAAHRRELDLLARSAGGPLTPAQCAAIRLSLNLRRSLARRRR
jgi:glycosyltransferase involved in cell wall biosynthesis